MNKRQETRNKKQEYKRILIVRMDKIGDLVLSTPVIKAVRDAYPDSHIAVLVRPYAREIVEGNPYIDEVITYDKTKNERTFSSNVKFILNLRKKKLISRWCFIRKTDAYLFIPGGHSGKGRL